MEKKIKTKNEKKREREREDEIEEKPSVTKGGLINFSQVFYEPHLFL